MGQCPTCQVGLSAPRDISKQSIKVCTARKLVIQPGAVAAAPVRKETATQAELAKVPASYSGQWLSDKPGTAISVAKVLSHLHQG